MKEQWKINLIKMSHVILAIILIQLSYFYFQIDKASTAIMSAVVIYQPFVGHLYLKLRNRLIGTTLGILYTFVISYFFIGDIYFFILCTILWFTFCTIIAGFIRPENAYVFLLSGYTCAFIAIPIYSHNGSLEIYHSLLYRSYSVLFGMSIIVLLALLIFPQYAQKDSLNSIQKIYRAVLGLKKKVVKNQKINLDELQAYFKKISYLISNSTLIKYEHHMNHMQAKYFDRFNLNSLLSIFYINSLRIYNKDPLSSELKTSIDQLIYSTRHHKTIAKNDRPKALIQSLQYRSPMRMPILRGLRTLIASIVLVFIWYFSAWEGSESMMLLAMVYIILMSSFPDAVFAAKEIFIGTFLGAISAYFYIIYIFSLPIYDQSSAVFFLVQLPVLILGSYMLVNAKLSLRGITYLTTFYYIYAPDNNFSIDYYQILNNSLGSILAMVFTGLVLIFIFPEKKQDRFPTVVHRYLKKLLRSMQKNHSSSTKELREFYDLLTMANISTTSHRFLIALNLSSLFLVVNTYLHKGLIHADLSKLIQELISSWLSKQQIHYDSQFVDRFKNLLLQSDNPHESTLADFFIHFLEDLKNEE